MRTTLSTRVIVVLVALAVPALAENKAPAGFDSMKSLVGEWQGKSAAGRPVSISYSLISGGTCLMETLTPTDEHSMVTIYCPDGDRLMMTHYCNGNNQPRMRAEAVKGDPKVLSFSFVDATNLSSPRQGHMHHLVVTLKDANHFAQEWSWRDGDKEDKETFTFERNI